MNILAVGDVVGEPGLRLLEDKLPGLRRQLGLDFVVVNGENAAETGTGVTENVVRRMLSAGADVITTGNHAFRKPRYEELFEENERLLRPANFMRGVSGRGWHEVDMGRLSVTVVNLIGQSFMGMSTLSPYDALEEALATTRGRVVLVDMHAESTSEKLALARCFDGRVSAIFGTHTHVPTADAQVLPGGTGYITDLGMTGPELSVLGVDSRLAIKKQRYGVPVRFSVASEGPSRLCAAIFEIEPSTGLALSVEQLKL